MRSICNNVNQISAYGLVMDYNIIQDNNQLIIISKIRGGK